MKQTPQCRGSVHDDFGVGFHQCMSKASVTRNGKPYCKRHDPLRVEKRTEARHRKWQQEWTAKAETQRKAENARKLTERKACIGAELATTIDDALTKWTQITFYRDDDTHRKARKLLTIGKGAA